MSFSSNVAFLRFRAHCGRLELLVIMELLNFSIRASLVLRSRLQAPLSLIEP
jgi:hypothetical protein